MKYKILITSVGSRVGQALLDSLEPVRNIVEILGINSTALAPNVFSCDKAFLVPATNRDTEFEQALGEIISNEKPDLVIPARDEELPVLSKLRGQERFDQSTILVGPEELCSIFNDKYETFLFARENRLPFTATAYHENEVSQLISRYGFPLIAKPRWNGHASKDVYLVENEEQASNLIAEQTFVLQEFINPDTVEPLSRSWDSKGIPWTFSIKDQQHIAELVIGKDGSVVSMSCNNSHISGEGGGKTWVITNDPEIESVALSYSKKLGESGYQGPLNLQGKKLQDGRFVPFELNGRFTGSTIARTLTGYNQVLHAFNHFVLGEHNFSRHEPQGINCAIKKTQDYDVIYQDRIDALLRKGVWP